MPDLEQQIKSLLRLEDDIYIEVLDAMITECEAAGLSTIDLKLGKQFLIDNPMSKQVTDRLKAKFTDDEVQAYININKAETFKEIQKTIEDALLEVSLTLQELITPDYTDTKGEHYAS